MGKSESFDFHNIENSSSMNDVRGHKKTGCYVSTATGFVLTLLAACLAVGVGIIVHFTTSGNTIDCKCSYPPNSGGNNDAQVGGTTPSTTSQKPILDQCKDLINHGNQELCSLCAGPTSLSPSSPLVPTTTVAQLTTTSPASTRNVRLPLNLYPTLYDVELQPYMYEGDAKDFYFTGNVKIEMQCIKSTNEIVLHSNKLNISEQSIQVMQMGSGSQISHSVEFDKVNQFLILKSNTQFMAGSNYSVYIEFRGPLTDDLAGLYLSSYKRGNDTIYIATSQMQPTDARKTFPCFDEPAVKAQFKVTLVRKQHMVSLSNTPITSNMTRGNGWIADYYEVTPKMSTYLLAFIICDFKYTVNITKNNVEYRAWARPEAVGQTPYSLDVGVKVLTYFEEYFDIPFPLPKSDMIAVPDFAAGAMENWGLITYRETAMLYDPMESAETNKQRVAVVVSHELAHQWFGNLVTPSWWDDLWLNEGFASFVEYMGVDHVHPDWLMFEQIVVEDLQDVFNFDGLVTSHPVYVPVSHPSQINEIFDRISYGKGATIIRMMRFFLGEETFKKGLQRYLKQQAYGAAFHDDLWNALSEQSKEDGKPISVQDVKHIMDTWTLQMNFPTVFMERTGPNIRLSQSRYLLDQNATDPGTYTSPFGYKWEIPVTYTSQSISNFNQTDNDISWMGRDGAVVEIKNAFPGESMDSWYIGNVMQYGYYRVNYPESNWQKLIQQLKTDPTKIHPINRAQIINDAWNLAKSGDLKMSIALQTVEYLSTEDNFLPYSAASGELLYVEDMLERTALFGAFSKFMKATFTIPFNKFGMDNSGSGHLETYVRRIVVSLACKYGNAECIGNATKLFRELMETTDGTNPIDVNLRSTVYCTAIRYGGVEEWDFAYKKYKTSNVATEKAVLLLSLSCSRDVWVLSRYLKYTLMPEEIRKQDAVSTIVYISRNTIGRSLVWDFVRGNWDFIFNEYGGGAFSFSRLITGITANFNTDFDLELVKSFKDSVPNLGSGARAFQQSIEKINLNIKWMAKNSLTVQDWLQTLS
ncbi:aminopeptidase N-like isoform X2 [Mytilus californianus]|uniref:aminopeptidase N-like isoform X2 n=1 Tax=Mytilus californianus TaxID=6549 RepID=UPI00224558E7|nr:aminopeptidase N-like isoform X2 [Mytilus californianus]